MHALVVAAPHDLAVDNQLKLRAGSCRGYQRGITITANDSVDEMTFSGRFPSGCKQYAMDRAALSHNEFAYGMFTSMWTDSGGKFRGGWQAAKAPEDEEPLRFDEQKLRSLRPAFGQTGTVTAGNASSVNDGAAAVCVFSEQKAEQLGVQPDARILGYSGMSRDP